MPKSNSVRDPQEVLDDCLEEIGMGPYQWKLFLLCGLGWTADNAWFQCLAVIVEQINFEYGLTNASGGISTTFSYIGMAIGAGVWGPLSDVIGRRTAFMYTFCITGIFGVATAFGHNIYVICSLLFCMGIGYGGNLPIDGALFLEEIPPSRQSLLTLLSLFWPVGQVLTSVIAWILLPNHSCSSYTNCPYESNVGWRLVCMVLGILTLVMTGSRYFFKLQESPKYLIARGRYDEAVQVLQELAAGNGKVLNISSKDFAESQSANELVRGRNASSLSRISSLFGKELRLTTILIWLIWSFVAVGYNIFNGFLPGFLASAGNSPLSVSQTYQSYVIISLAAVPGSILGMYMTDWEFLGRRGTMVLSTTITAASLFLFTYFNSNTGQLISSCITGFSQNIMYGVLFAYTPEVFPSYIRATAYGIAASLGSWAGAVAPTLTFYLLKFGYSLPLHLSAGLLLISAILMAMLPIETRNRASS